MTQIDISQGETEQIVPSDQADRAYIAEVSRATVKLGHSERYGNEGTEIVPGDRVRLDNLRGKAVYATAIDGDATIVLDTAGINVEYMARATTSNISQLETVNEVQTINELQTLTDAPQLSNDTTVTAQSFDPTNATPSIAVPDNATAIVQAASSNADPVIIDGAFELAPGDSVRIRTSDTSNIATDGTAGEEAQILVPGGS